MLITTATDLPRLMTCIGSRLMGGAKVPPIAGADSTVRDEGNAFHWLNEVVQSGEFTIEELADRKAPNGLYITNEMVDHYKEYVSELPDGERFVEVDTSHGVQQHYTVKGRADEIIHSFNELFIIDTKYGHSLVEVQDNWTLISHAVGWLLAHPLAAKAIQNVTFAIYQPRGYHRDGIWRTHSITRDELQTKSTELYNRLCNATDELRTSDHCKRCPAAHSCPANKRAGGNAIDVIDIAFVETLTGDDLSYALDSLSTAIKRGKARYDSLCELAEHQISQGQIVKNYSLQRKSGNERWRDGVTITSMQLVTGQKLAKDKMLTPNQARNEGIDPKVVAAFSHRPETGLKLERISANAVANKLFKGI